MAKEEKKLINCLKNERVIVRFILRRRGVINDPKHVLYGGMAETATRSFTVPLLKTGGYVNVLTNDEKDYLEHIMGLEPNALSVHKKENNFWDDSNPNGVGRVTLKKKDTYLDLSNPVDYIKYKILLANKNLIAPSLRAYQDMPKATYEYMIISENNITEDSKLKVSNKARAYREFGKVEDNADILKLIIETMDGRPVAKNTKLDLLQAKIGDLIDSNAKMFVTVVTDELLPTKVTIRKAVEKGIIANRGGLYYYKNGNTVVPLCGDNAEPRFNVAAEYLNQPKNQELKFTIEAKIKE